MEPWTLDEMETVLTEAMGSSDDDTKPTVELRLRILEIASGHFVRFGYRRTNIGEIAADAGIGKGSFYLHFNSKKTLLLACLAYEKLSLLPQLEAILALEPSQRLRRFLEIAFRFAIDAPLTSAYLRGDRELTAVVADYDTSHKENREWTKAFIAGLIDPGNELSEERRQSLVNVVGTLSRLAAHLPAHAAFIGVQPDEVATELATVFARGIAVETSE